MKIVTKDRATSVKLRFLIFAFLTIALIAFLFLTDYVKQIEVPIAVVVNAVFIYIYYFLKRYMYFSYNDEEGKIVLRYFNLIPSTLDHHSIEISKRNLVSFEIKNSMFNLRKELIITQKTKNGIAKYPPVSISLLNDEEKFLLSESLSEIIKGNK